LLSIRRSQGGAFPCVLDGTMQTLPQYRNGRQFDQVFRDPNGGLIQLQQS
jgi:hypothetical protein